MAGAAGTDAGNPEKSAGSENKAQRKIIAVMYVKKQPVRPAGNA